VAAVLCKPCALRFANDAGVRIVPGIVTSFTRIVTSQKEPGRRYRAVVEPAWALLRLRHLSRVFQHVTVPDLVKDILVRAGFPAHDVVQSLAEEHAEREYVVQWQEDDLSFLRRLCEEEGLYFRTITGDLGENFSIEDASTFAPPVLQGPITVADGSGLSHPELAAWAVRLTRTRRPGKVTLRDYDPKKPAVNLEASASAGTGIEKATEVYEAPGRFTTPAVGQSRAERRLQSLRAGAKVLHFETNALALSPGDAFTLEHGAGYAGTPSVKGDWVATAVRCSWSVEGAEGPAEAGSRPASETLAVEAIPKDVPFRLPRVTPRPRIFGVQPALVTGAPGTEIYPDAAGRVFVRFFWDREGPGDHKSSLPVRVVQPNMPGSMVIPRVGWEVAIAFEDGDPDRPYVLGRVYNAKTPPPFPLPANKTVTALRSFSSPGGATHNTIHFDDAAGRQHLSIHAGFAKTTTVGNHMVVQTKKVEKTAIDGSQAIHVSGNDSCNVTEALIVSAASQTATVGGSQEIYVKGNLNVATGSEGVTVGGALLEKIGNPVTGALNLGVNAALAGAGALGQRLGPVGQTLTNVATTAAGIGWGMVQAATAPGAGPNAARDAGIRGVLGAAAGHVPGGSALMSSLTGGGRTLPWEHPPERPGAAAAGGGAGGGASDSSAAAGPGPGHRNEVVKGPYTECIGGAHVVTTPGNINWQTTGASAITVGGSHTMKAVTVGVRVLGAYEENLGSLKVKSGSFIGRDVKGPVITNVAGTLKINADGGVYSMKAGSKITLQAAGPLQCEGGVVVFVVGHSVVAASPGGVLVKAGTIKINGPTKQSGDTTH
jgi:type VI secretion system secreted protein VgrG